MVVDVNQGCHAVPGYVGILCALLEAGTCQVANNLRAVLVAARLGGGVDFREKIVFDGNGDPLHSSNPADPVAAAV